MNELRDLKQAFMDVWLIRLCRAAYIPSGSEMVVDLKLGNEIPDLGFEQVVDVCSYLDNCEDFPVLTRLTNFSIDHIPVTEMEVDFQRSQVSVYIKPCRYEVVTRIEDAFDRLGGTDFTYVVIVAR